MGRGGRCAEEIGKPVGLKVEPEEGGVRSIWGYDFGLLAYDRAYGIA